MMMKLDTSRDPVDVAEQQRDYDETHGDWYTRSQERAEYEANKADLYHGETDE